MGVSAGYAVDLVRVGSCGDQRVCLDRAGRIVDSVHRCHDSRYRCSIVLCERSRGSTKVKTPTSDSGNSSNMRSSMHDASDAHSRRRHERTHTTHGREADQTGRNQNTSIPDSSLDDYVWAMCSHATPLFSCSLLFFSSSFFFFLISTPLLSH